MSALLPKADMDQHGHSVVGTRGRIEAFRSVSRRSRVSKLSVNQPLPGANQPTSQDQDDQCDMSTGVVIVRNMVRVTPPSTNSRKREWP